MTGDRVKDFRNYVSGLYEQTETAESDLAVPKSAMEARDETVLPDEEESAAEKKAEKAALVIAKRARNTEAARKSRAKKVARVKELEEQVKKMEEGKDSAA